MEFSAEQLNRATLQRQLLLERTALPVPEAVGRLVGLQAQDAASPYLALWNRVAQLDPVDVDSAFAGRVVVRAPLLRLTLHAVHARDWPAWHRAMAHNLRASRVADRRFLAAGITAAEVDALIPGIAAALDRPLPEDQVRAEVDALLGRHEPRAWWALRRYAPLLRAPTGGPWSFDAAEFVAGDGPLGPEAEQESVGQLLLRYLRAFGPASPQDFAQFTMLRRPAVQRALADLDGRIEQVPGPGRARLFDVSGATLPAADTPAPPRLLPMWDAVLLGYADRGRVLPPEFRAAVLRRNGDVLPTLLVDGHVAGVWRPVAGGVEATAFRPLDERAWDGLAAEAAALTALLAGRDPDVYARYGHWWGKGLPADSVRVLPG